MTSKARHVSRQRMVALPSVILAVCGLFAACDKAPQDEGRPLTNVETIGEKPAQTIE